MDYRKLVLHQHGQFLRRWNIAFLVLCAFSLLLDPLFLYIPAIDRDNKCLLLDKKLEIAAITLRSLTDFLYIIHIIFQCYMAFLVPSSRKFESDSSRQVRRYLSSYFLIDILAILPLPQVAMSIVNSERTGSTTLNTKNVLKFVVPFQFVPRFLRIYQLYKSIMRSSYALAKTVQTRAAITLFLYVLAGHVVGAFWYFFSMERKFLCWQEASTSLQGFEFSTFFCDGTSGNRTFPANYTSFNTSCPTNSEDNSPFDFGMYFNALKAGVHELHFSEKFFFCFWWALQNLSTLGQNLKTSTQIWEICFAISIFVSGLIIYSFVLGIIQTTMLSSTVRLEEMKTKWEDVEHWMDSHMLPNDLKKRIRRHEQYKWQNTKGADVEDLLGDLPKYLRRDIKHCLCHDLLVRVPIFEKMDEHLLAEICDSLKPALYTEESYIIRQGDPIDEMLFIMRGELYSMTAHGGKTGFCTSINLKAGDFCGEELLHWAIDPNSADLPCSNRTVQTRTEVEAFILLADDLKSIVSKFMQHHGEHLHHLIKHFSWQWKTWAAYYIQAAWHHYKERKLARSLAI